MRTRAEISAVIARGRAAAENIMIDTVRVTRDATRAGISDDWGRTTTPAPTVVYEGPAKAQNDRTYPSTPDVAGAARVATVVSAVHFPYGTTAVRAGDVCEWITSENPRLVGTRVRLRVDEDKTWQTAVRFNAEEVT